MAENFNPDELMIIESARHIRDGETVFAGTGMPLVAATYAQKTHAPNMCCVIETGPIAPDVLPVPISVSDPKAMHRAAKLGTLREVLGCLLQRGLVDVGFLGGAEIDQYGNINSTVVGDYRRPKVRFPGSGGANDIASHARRILIICPRSLYISTTLASPSSLVRSSVEAITPRIQLLDSTITSTSSVNPASTEAMRMPLFLASFSTGATILISPS